jgi:hypothetical protein
MLIGMPIFTTVLSMAAKDTMAAEIPIISGLASLDMTIQKTYAEIIPTKFSMYKKAAPFPMLFRFRYDSLLSLHAPRARYVTSLV